MTKKNEVISLALAGSMVEIQGARYDINPVESFTLGVLMKNKPEYLSTSDIANAGTDYERSHITYAMRSVVPKVNEHFEVIGSKRQAGTGAHLFSMLGHVVEAGFSAPIRAREFKVRDPYWYQDAACGIENAAEFNTSDNGKSRHLKSAWQQYCETCVVSDDCLADAVINDDQHTIRAGTLPHERLPLVAAHKLFIGLAKGDL